MHWMSNLCPDKNSYTVSNLNFPGHSSWKSEYPTTRRLYELLFSILYIRQKDGQLFLTNRCWGLKAYLLFTFVSILCILWGGSVPISISRNIVSISPELTEIDLHLGSSFISKELTELTEIFRQKSIYSLWYDLRLKLVSITNLWLSLLLVSRQGML